MNTPWDIKGEDIERWAARMEAAPMLPELVRRLLLASGVVQSLDMRADSGVRLPGWDGIVLARKVHPYCPPGLSVWEMSVQADVQDKLNEDFEKRSQSPAPPVTQPGSVTYVALTARRFRLKQEWMAAKKALGHWADVVVHDADDLAAWLAQNPVVGRWFAAKLGLPTGDLAHVLDVETFLQGWCNRTQPSLPSDLVLSGPAREDAAALLRSWLRADRPSRLNVRSETREEAIVFAAAALVHAPQEDRERWLARAAVVESREAWRWMVGLQCDAPPILLPVYEGFEPSEAVGKGFVVVPWDVSQPWNGSRPITEARIELEPMPHKPLAMKLEYAGLRQVDAMRLARESGGKLSALQRLSGYAELPGWTSGVDRDALFVMLWVGAWQPGNEADAEVLRKLGSPSEDVEALCVELSQRAEQPVRLDTERWGHGVWRWTSTSAAWQAMARGLTRSRLEGFATVTLAVLGEIDPRYELPKDQRWFAAAYGKVFKHSEALRESMTESIVRLALCDEELLKSIDGPRGRQMASAMVERLLGPEWRRWASLAPLLPTLAEAAPSAFLKAIEESLGRSDEGVSHLLAEEMELGESPHTALLWALEALGWSREWMPRVAYALAQLTERDPGGKLSNRPLQSLKALLHEFLPQTLAPFEDRLQVLRQLMHRSPEVGWKLALERIKVRASAWHTFLHPSHRPQHLNWPLPSPDQPSLSPPEEQERSLASTVDLLIPAAGANPSRWADLIDACIGLDDETTTRILTALQVALEQAGMPGTEPWSALRHFLACARREERSDDATEMARRLYEAATPAAPVDQSAWLFLSWPQLLELDAEEDERQYEELVTRKRTEALRLLWRQDDRLGLLAKLLSRGPEVAYHLGRALSHEPFADEFEQILLNGKLPEDCLNLTPAFIASLVRRSKRDFAWLEKALRALLRGRPELASRALLYLEPSRTLWQLADALGAEVQSQYWGAVQGIHGEHPSEDWEWAISRLLDVGHPIQAASVASTAWQIVSASTVLRVLESIRDMASQAVVTPPQQVLSPTWVERLLSRLDADPTIEPIRLAHLELFFLNLLKDTRRSTPHLFRILEENPQVFVGVLELLDRPRGQQPKQEPSSDEVARAQAAFKLLEAWERYPGFESPAAEREEQLLQWATAVRELAARSGRDAVAQSEVAKVLARAPAAEEDGLWPCRAARVLLRAPQWNHLRDALKFAHRNMSPGGRRMRPLDELRQARHDFASAFSFAAERLRIEWSETATMLTELAEGYLEDVRRMEQSERSERLRYGWDREKPRAESLQAPPPTSGSSFPLEPVRRLEFQNVNVAKRLSFDFGPRLNLLAGDNSTGKTLLLDIMWWSLTGLWSHGHKVVPTPEQHGRLVPSLAISSGGSRISSTFIKEREEWSRPPEWPLSSSLAIYARADGGFSVWDPIRGRSHDFMERDLRDGFPSDADGKVACNGLVRDWVDWQQKQQGTFDALCKALAQLSSDDIPLKPGLPMRVSADDTRIVPTLEMSYGRVPIIHASAAIKRVIGLAYLLVWSWREHAEAARLLQQEPAKHLVLLVDEVESHLHPKWQRRILPAVLAASDSLAAQLAVQLFVSTHAPLVTASIETHFHHERDKVFHFHFAEDGQVEVEERPLSK